MIPLTEIRDLEVFEAVPDSVVRIICADAEALEFHAGDVIVHQHDEARSLYVLVSGTVEFLIRVEGVDDLVVGMTSQRGAVLGWSIVREPHRYTATIRCTEPCRVFRIARPAIAQLVASDPRAGYAILQAIAVAVAERLQDTLGLLAATPKTGPSAQP
ncbi:MAG: cyclic nucleotide-binding domain-containing protein [Gammaproteobacteria bacterium]